MSGLKPSKILWTYYDTLRKAELVLPNSGSSEWKDFLEQLEAFIHAYNLETEREQ